jgi:hypothetical protein
MVLGIAPSGRFRRVARLLPILLVAAYGTVLAHERFVKHRLKVPLHEEFFHQGEGLLGMNPDMLNVATRVFAILALFLLAWYIREPLDKFARRLMRPLGSRIQSAAHEITCFLTDRPVHGKPFQTLREWSTILFLRSPGLVLMYSATNDSLIMPSYPLDPASAELFKFAQVGLALLMLTQTALPLCGALVVGTWLYLFRWGWIVAIDAVPVLTVAVVYMAAPWQSHKLAITEINENQMRWVRRVLGAGFVALGWLKIYNHDLVAGVADNYPAVMADPALQLLWVGTSEGYARETWIVAFGLAEVMSGFLLMMGVFSRIWGSITAFMFIKLMLVDFGWAEIPHIYPIAALLVIVSSNRLSSDLGPIERAERRLGRSGKSFRRGALVVGAVLLVAFLVIYPLLYYTTFLDRSNL